jgi:hypothetical protein
MEENYPRISFNYIYNGEAVVCMAVMKETFYELYFDFKYICNIEMDDDWEWRACKETILSPQTVDEIGLHIQHYLDYPANFDE